MRADKIRRLAEVTAELAHFTEMEEDFLRTMYYAGRRGDEIKQEWKSGRDHAAAMRKEYLHDFRALLKRYFV